MGDSELRAALAPTPGYRYAEVVGDRLFVAGQVPLDVDGELIGPGNPGRQAIACLRNLHSVVDVYGFDTEDVRHLTIHVVGDRANLLAAWAEVTEWFDHDVPPATLLGVHLLGYPGQLVEIDAAVMRDA